MEAITRTAINVAPYYLANISYELSKVAGISLKQADDLIDATQNLITCLNDRLSDLLVKFSRLFIRDRCCFFDHYDAVVLFQDFMC